ncbi:uncharacterized protein [Aegilops tauschii subsp. strangulata]|uniref:uncharacterized protein n=1 Tax=Aegilops tauschii subsp. strangulata TaxID=200361 RepID=UPI00098B7BB7|nr:uncharacterized protein LOC109732975 [Aegilops tauschii subsp. strangulata]
MSMRRLGALNFRGVRECRSGAFSSEIWFGEKCLILGTFDTAEEAARTHDAAAWRLLRPRREMNFLDVSSQRAQDLAPLPRLFTDEDRRDHQRRQRCLAIAEMDVEAMVVWCERFPQDIVDEHQFYKQRRTEREARRTERAAYREDKRARKQSAQLNLKLGEASSGTPRTSGDIGDEAGGRGCVVGWGG